MRLNTTKDLTAQYLRDNEVERRAAQQAFAAGVERAVASGWRPSYFTVLLDATGASYIAQVRA